MGNSIIPSNEPNISDRTSPRTLSWNTQAKFVDGSTSFTSCRRCCSTALHFGTAWSHGTLLAADGKKISKSLKNYTDPLELMDKYGADSVRMYLLASAAVQADDLSFRDDGVETVVRIDPAAFVERVVILLVVCRDRQGIAKRTLRGVTPLSSMNWTGSSFLKQKY